MRNDMTRLGDLCEFRYGKSLPEPTRRPGNVLVYGSNGIVGTHDEALTASETIIIGRKGSVGQVHLSDKSCWPIDTTYYVDRSASEVDLPWLSRALRSLRLPDLNKAAAVPGLNRSDAYDLKLFVPRVDEQRRIAAILDKADALRRKRKRALNVLDSLTESIFLEMFGDPLVNPNGLRKMPLGDVIKVKSGNGLVTRDMAAGGRYPVYGGNGINGYHDEFMFSEPKLVIGRVGFYCGAVHLTGEKSWITDNALYISELKVPASLHYLKAALSIANLNRYADRAAQPLVSGGRIYPVEILVPSRSLQSKFEVAIDRVAVTSKLLEAVYSLTNALFATLQHRAFSGQL